MKNNLRELIKECIQEVALEEYQKKQAVKKKITPLIRETIKEFEASDIYWFFVDNAGNVTVQNVDRPSKPDDAVKFARLSADYVANKPELGKYLQKVILRGGAIDDKVKSALRSVIKPQMWKDADRLQALTKTATAGQM